MQLSGYYKDAVAANANTPLLLMIHPFPMTHKIWLPLIERLSNVPVGMYAPDMRGYDGAPVPLAEEWSIAAMVGDILESLDALRVQRGRPLIVMGSSMGGYMAFEFWRTCPDRIGQIYIVNSRANADTDAVRANRTATRARLDSEGPAFLIDAQPKNLLGALAQADAAVLQFVLDMGRSVPLAALHGTLHALGGRVDSTPTLATIEVPVVITSGTDDVLSPPAVAAAMAARVCGADLYELTGVGHLPMIEAPDVFAKIVRESLIL